MQYLSEIQRIVLKRSKIEEWVDEHFDFLHDTLVGCFVQVSFKGSYKLAEIVDVKEVEDGPKANYVLGKKNTNI